MAMKRIPMFRLRRRIRGVILSTEMMLLLTGVIMFAVLAFLGMSHMVLSQATSSKQTLVLVDAKAWRIDNGVVVSMYVQNTGDTAVTINGIGIKFAGQGQFITCSAPVSVTVNPGESKQLSYSFIDAINCKGIAAFVATGPGISIYTFVHTANGDTVGTSVKLLNPT